MVNDRWMKLDAYQDETNRDAPDKFSSKWQFIGGNEIREVLQEGSKLDDHVDQTYDNQFNHKMLKRIHNENGKVLQ